MERIEELSKSCLHVYVVNALVDPMIDGYTCMRRNIVRFLMRLNDSFAQTRRQIIMMDSLPTFTEIYNFVAQDE